MPINNFLYKIVPILFTNPEYQRLYSRLILKVILKEVLLINPIQINISKTLSHQKFNIGHP